MHRRAFLTSAAAAALAAPALAGEPPVATVYRNARIWDGVSPATRLGTIAVDTAGRIAARPAQGARVVDLEGAFLCPGFIDNHTHFLLGSLALTRLPLLDVKTPAELAARVGEAARSAPPGRWIEGWGWDEQRWGGPYPTRALLDPVTGDRPVILNRTDGHTVVVNSAALRLAGVTRDTPDPQGGKIERDAKGEPTGLLKDLAWDLVQRIVPEPTEAQEDEAVRLGVRHGLSHGVTQVHGTDMDWLAWRAMRRWRARGGEGFRFYGMVPLMDWEKIAAIIKTEGHGDQWVRWGGCKELVDGALGSRTALMREDFSNDPGNRGFTRHKFEDIIEWARGADAAGLQIACHAIGDLANAGTLDLFAEVARRNGPRDRRFRIEHAQHLAPDLIPRFAAQKVIASMQPYHAIDDGRWAAGPLGPQRVRYAWPIRSLMAAGATVTFGSDWPVAPLDPITGIAAAVLRQTTDGKQVFGPEERVTTVQALTAYTRNNAYAGFQERTHGRIAPGYVADLTVLDRDPLSVPHEDLAKLKVVRTIVGGVDRYVA